LRYVSLHPAKIVVVHSGGPADQTTIFESMPQPD
jgi:hypothetical protein